MRKLHLFLSCVVFLFIGVVAYAQNINVSGTVTDAQTGEGVPFASIQVRGTMTGTSTDADGNYTISVPKNATLVFSSIGYINQEAEVGGRTTINILLAPDTESLDELVVVAYGVAKRESVTGSVSTVKNESIAQRPLTNVTNVLEGAVTGVLTTGGGDPGGGQTIRIRGVGSVTGENSPLYIIDGVPFSGYISDLNPNDIESLTVLKDATSAALYGNRASNGVIMITTKRGKSDKVGLSVSVNQGFYNRAIPEYDKVSAQEFMQVFFDGYVNNLQSNSNMTREAAINDVRTNLFTYIGQYNIFNVPTESLYDSNGTFNSSAQILPGYDDLNWWDYVMRTGYRQDYNVNGSGASDKSNYFFSVGYTDEQGQTINSDMTRWTGRANVSVTPVKWLRAGVNINSAIHTENYRSSGTAYANTLYQAHVMAPIYSVYLHNPDGSYLLDENGDKQYDAGELYSRPQYTSRHSIWETEMDLRFNKRLSTSAQAYTDITFLKDFTLSIKGDIGLRWEEDRTYNNAIIGDGAGNNGRASRTSYFYKNYTFQQLLNWGHSFGNHNVEALVGHENYYYNYDYQYGYKTNETIPFRQELVNFTDITSLTGYYSGYRLESYLSRLKYNYANKYFLEGSYRRDGSSRFYKDNRWGNFWSVGATWAISREEFMKNVGWVDNLRLRASYGEVGNDRSVGYYGYMSLYSLSMKYGGVTAAYKSQNEALDLQWEAEKSFSTALEGRLFNRLNFTVEYFNKVTHDLLFDVEKPTSQGGISFGSVTAATTANIGSVSNHGVELSMDVDIIRNRDFNWNFGVNATWMKNTILQLPPATITNYDGLQNAIRSGTKLYAEGYGMYDYNTYLFVGVDQMTGLALYEIDDKVYYILDQNIKGQSWNDETQSFDEIDKTLVPDPYGVVINGKEYVTSTTYAKRDYTGDQSLPKMYGSFNTSLRWKNFTFSALFTYALGSKCIDGAYQDLMSVGLSPHSYHVDVLKSWNGAPAGMTETSADRIDPNGIPRVDGFWSSYSNATSTRFFISGNYLIVKNVNMSYSLPRKWVNTLGLSGITLSASVDNLWSFTAKKGLNPQQSLSGSISGYSINTPRIGTFGVRVNF
ncbi:MAG: SusC/RagA family TonB-linked outer membrane protein [Bacteroidales bacterium]|nr:SusC/RagA family TonB-linked outer membrane protein [Bacteroidales bacterium]